MANVVGDEVLGKIARQQCDLFRRVREGSLSPEQVESAHRVLQDFADGKVPDLVGLARGTHEILPVSRLIDLDADPFVPEGWEVVKHVPGGQFQFNPTKVKLWLSDQQKTGAIKGDDLLEQVVKQNPFNANLLDWYLKPKNQKLIPEEWKKLITFFWGTRYRGRGGYLCVRCLDWRGGRWRWGCLWIDFEWHALYPALVLASV